MGMSIYYYKVLYHANLPSILLALIATAITVPNDNTTIVAR